LKLPRSNFDNGIVTQLLRAPNQLRAPSQLRAPNQLLVNAIYSVHTKEKIMSKRHHDDGFKLTLGKWPCSLEGCQPGLNEA
jgi:hypothetical protein